MAAQLRHLLFCDGIDQKNGIAMHKNLLINIGRSAALIDANLLKELLKESQPYKHAQNGEKHDDERRSLNAKEKDPLD